MLTGACEANTDYNILGLYLIFRYDSPMATEDSPAAGTEESIAAAAPKRTETLSQFVARVLNQLSLSAWLPSAALVLMLDFIVELGAQLDAKSQGPAGALGNTFAKMSGIGIGGIALLVVAVIVLTMLTQAFSFEAIQFLEGYWGISKIAEWFACRRCDKHRRSLDRLDVRRKELINIAWMGTEAKLKEEQAERRKRGKPVQLTPNMLSVLGARILEEEHEPIDLTPEEERVVRPLETGWEYHAPADPLRRRANVDQCLADYPAAHRMLPTRLGNILRAHEDQIRQVQVRSFVQEVFDELPPALQDEHDEQRTRLDLYCSMVFILAVAGGVAVLRLAVNHWPFALCSAAITVIGMYVMYGAALATARAYGNLLLTIRDYVAANAAVEEAPPGSSA